MSEERACIPFHVKRTTKSLVRVSDDVRLERRAHAAIGGTSRCDETTRSDSIAGHVSNAHAAVPFPVESNRSTRRVQLPTGKGGGGGGGGGGVGWRLLVGLFSSRLIDARRRGGESGHVADTCRTHHGAPAASRARTTSTWPFSHASISGVTPLRSCPRTRGRVEGARRARHGQGRAARKVSPWPRP